MPVIIFNKHANPDYSWCDEVVSVMRPNRLGNPFPITRHRDRNAAVVAFRAHLDVLMREDTPERREVLRLAAMHYDGKNVGLLCCCSPLVCHADVIKGVILSLKLTPPCPSI